MAITDTESDQIIQAVNAKLGSFGKAMDNVSKNLNTRDKAAKQLNDDLEKTNKKRVVTENKILETTSKLLSGIDGLKGVLLGAGGLGAIGYELISMGEKTVQSYRKVREVGQTFGGSMIGLAKSAAEAGMPLDDFAEAVAKNGTVISRIGVQSFSAIQKQVRRITEASGMYGMTMEQLGEYGSEYLETQRLAGMLEKKTDTQRAQGVAELAASVSTISTITGKARDQILKDSQEALRDTNVSAQMRINSIRGMTGYNDAVGRAITDLSAQNGAAGALLSKGLADTFSHFGHAEMTELGKTFAAAGVSGGTAILNDANKRIQAGEDEHKVAMDVVTQMDKILNNTDTMRNLQMLGESGNTFANTLLELGGNLKTYTLADRQKAAEQNAKEDAITALFSSLGSILKSLKGSFIAGILAPFEKLSKGVPADAIVAKLQLLEPIFTTLGQTLGNWINSITPEKVDSFGKGVSSFVDGVLKAVPVVMGFLDTIVKGFTAWNNFIGGIPFINDGLKAFLGIISPFVAMFVGKSLIGMIFDAFKSTNVGVMKVNAGMVQVGGLGGKGGNGFGGLEGDAKTAAKLTQREKDAQNLLSAAKKTPGLAQDAGFMKAAKLAGIEKDVQAAAGLAGKAGIMGKVGGVLSKGAGMVGKVTGAVGDVGSVIGKIPGLSLLGKVGGKVAKVLGPAGAAIGAGFGVVDLGSDLMKHAKGQGGTKRTWMDRLNDAAWGAVGGAELGGVVGGVAGAGIGAIPGAIVGGIGGALTGAFGKDITSAIGDGIAAGNKKTSSSSATPKPAATPTVDAAKKEADATSTATQSGGPTDTQLLQQILDQSKKNNELMTIFASMMHNDNKATLDFAKRAKVS